MHSNLSPRANGDNGQEVDAAKESTVRASAPSQRVGQSENRRGWRVLLLLAIVAGIYFPRLSTLPVRGEESRWARAAAQMVELGDWIVPRQQGTPYVDRPPLAQWAIAGTGLLTGKIDPLSIRLPSAVSVLLTVLLIYRYGRTFLQPLGAFAAGLVYATFGQVLQLGRLAENEALYTLLLGGALLAWHAGYSQGANRLGTWLAGFLLAAGATLIKGPQAPVYFVAVTTVYLVLRRDWKWLFSWQTAAGAAAFAVLVGGWQLAFLLATDWDSAIGIWTRSSAQRYAVDGLGKHLATFPFEVLGCLLPWSPMLLGYVRPGVRRQLGGVGPTLLFLLTAVAVTFPSVWLAAGARGRYFMPLYPCLALLVALVIERSVLAESGTPARKGWELFVTILGSLIAGGGAIVLLASLTGLHSLDRIAQPIRFAWIFALLAGMLSAWLLTAGRRSGSRPAHLAIAAIAIFLGVAQVGVVTNVDARRANDLAKPVAKLKSELETGRLVSFGPVDHRFAFYFGETIRELPWPRSVAQLPREVRYFCYKHHYSDTAEQRSNGRGMYWETTPGTLPFAWREIARLPCDRSHCLNPEVTMVVGEVMEPITAVRARTEHR